MIEFQEKMYKNTNHTGHKYHTYRILVVGGSEIEKPNKLFNVTNHQPEYDKSFYKFQGPIQAKVSVYYYKA